ncbi:hypothetical protein ATCC90586_000231 [Pythium insidiosum]|nr:hypothetical protein ATCC90586_000231 [Pythium insidiosum]
MPRRGIDALLSKAPEEARPSDSEDSASAAAQLHRSGSHRRCLVSGCDKVAKSGGLCISHGGGKKCVIDGCSTTAVSRGLCIAHGGGKRCQREGCTKSAQTGGFCWIHGGGKKCGHDGCTKRAQSGGACISHGGGKRCRFEGCHRVVQFQGLCVTHGGYRKCSADGCEKKAVSNGYCARHRGHAIFGQGIMALEEWIRAKVQALALDVDVYVDYARGILEDEDTDVEERVQSVIAIFSGAVDDTAVDADILANELNEARMVKDVERHLMDDKARHKQEADLRRAEIELRDLQLREQEKREAELAKEKEKEKMLARQKMSREELAQREKLISEYGFSAISEFDEEGNLIKVNDKDKEASGLDSSVGQNTNRQRVQEHQAAMRAKMKQEHEKKVARDKELQEKERLKKEKAKRRTQKREKQRGAG